jgi:2-polyprenyl-3-methyl-5-hydroxy-6-metoxy-1,4-benzoquinol methylase
LHHQAFAAPRELHVPQSYDVVACERCGFVYADQATPQHEIDRDYEAHSKYAANVAEPAATHAAFPTDAPWDASRLDGVATYLADRLPASLRVLDAGCSSGTFLRYLKEKGFDDVVGLDPSHEAVASAIQHNGVRAFAGSFTTPPPDLGTFDVVTLSHTLEHIADVRSAIGSLEALLKPAGIAYIEVPDAERYDSYLVAPFHDFNTEHINHFSLGVLRTLMRNAGFEEIDSAAKIVYCSERDEYPAIFGLWRKVQRPTNSADNIHRDEALVAAARRYVDASRRRMSRIDKALRADLGDRDDVILWGAGQLSMKLLRDTVLATKRIAAIVDSSPQRHGMHVGSTEIVAPTALRELPPFPIVITSIHSDEAIAQTIERRMALPHQAIRLYRAAPN